MRTLRGVNLNLLPVLQALLHHQNVTRAAEALHMSQSAVSDALGSLRKVFDDELLVRTGRGMTPTELATSLVPQVNAAIDGIHDLFDVPPFHAEALDRRFTIMTADSVMMTIGPALVAAFAAEAPNASLRFEQITAEAVTMRGASGVDAIIVPAGTIDGMRQLPLYVDEFVCIMRADHPLRSSDLTIEDYLAWPHARFHPPKAEEQTFEARRLAEANLNQSDIVRVPQFSLLPYFVEASDHLALLPRRLAERMQATTAIHVVDPPFPLETTTITLHWSEVHHRDPAHQWFRELIRSVSPGTAEVEGEDDGEVDQ